MSSIWYLTSWHFYNFSINSFPYKLLRPLKYISCRTKTLLVNYFSLLISAANINLTVKLNVCTHFQHHSFSYLNINLRFYYQALLTHTLSRWCGEKKDNCSKKWIFNVQYRWWFHINKSNCLQNIIVDSLWNEKCIGFT